MNRTRRLFPTALALAGLWALSPSQATAQDSPWSVGLQSSWPAYGISGRYDYSDEIRLQAVLGALGRVTNFAGRINKTFRDEPLWDLFAFGSVGLWRYGYFSASRARSLSETSIGIGAGAGFEFDFQEVFDDSDFPPLFGSVELGLTFANFDNYSWSLLGLGIGLHYDF